MIETQGIIYKCQHCDYVSANKNQTKIHEEKCLKEQEKVQRNKELRSIYELMNINEINERLKIFRIKYYNNASPATVSIHCDDSIYFSLDYNPCGLIDKYKFKLYQKAEEYNKITVESNFIDINDEISEKEFELKALKNKKGNLILSEFTNFISS